MHYFFAIVVDEGGDVDVFYPYIYNFRSSLHQDVPHGFHEFRPIIKTAFICNDSTRVFVIMWPSCTKSNSGINIIAVICIVGDKTDPCFGSLKFPISCQWIKIEPLSVTVNLRGGLWTSQGSPCVTSQWRVSVLPISDKWVQRVSPLVDDYEPELLVNLHTETDLWEGWDPVSR